MERQGRMEKENKTLDIEICEKTDSLYINITNIVIMQAEQSILDRIQRRQLKWYEHLLRMEDSCWPKKIYHWTPHGSMKRGKPLQSWKSQVTDFMRSRKI